MASQNILKCKWHSWEPVLVKDASLYFSSASEVFIFRSLILILPQPCAVRLGKSSHPMITDGSFIFEVSELN